MMRLRGVALGAAVAALVMLSPIVADAQVKVFKADLKGAEEPPSVSSTGSGIFLMAVNDDDTSFDYFLSFQGLEGTVTQGHIHVGQLGVNGGISIWLCQTEAATGPPGTPDCGGPGAGSVVGSVTAAQVVGPAGQGVAPGEFAEVLKVMREGATYANVHSTRNPGGEIRGQIK